MHSASDQQWVSEILRIIREEEPPRPSYRLSSIETLPNVAANRKMEPAKLTGLVRGELDWIVMKALDKDRSRRYETANGLAMDIQRYLNDQPVAACPPGAAYCFRKFARRNKGALATAAAILGVMCLGTAVSVSQAIRTKHAEREAQAALVAEQEQRVGDTSIQAELAVAHYRLAMIHRELGNSPESQAANRSAIDLLEALRNQQIDGLEPQSILAQAYLLAGRYDETVQWCQEILGIHPEAVEIRSTLAQAYNSLAIEAHTKDAAATALKYHQLALTLREGLANEFPDNARHNAELAATLNNIGVLLNRQRKHSESLAMYQLALPYSVKASSQVPHSVLWARWLANILRNLGTTHRELGDADEALSAFERQAAVWRRLIIQNPAVSELPGHYYKALLLLADQQRRMGLTVEAIRSFRDAENVLRDLPRKTPGELFELAIVYASLATPPVRTQELGDNEEAEDERRRCADLAMQTLGRWDVGQGEQARFASLLVPFGEFESHRRYCRDVSEVWLTQDSSGLATFPEDLVWLSSLNPEPPNELTDWIELIKAKGELTPGDIWRRRAIAFGCFRLGRHVEVIDLLAAETFSEIPDCSLLVAMSHHALGNAREAEDWLVRAEADFRQMVDAWLSGLDIWRALPKNWDLQIPPTSACTWRLPNGSAANHPLRTPGCI